MALTEQQIASVRVLLPAEAERRHGWDDETIELRWDKTAFRTVRQYWLDRVNATAGYIDLPSDGLPASQLHEHAKAMLAYWDQLISQSVSLSGELFERGSRTRKIKRV